ncbi:hypothetical protein CHS0354_042734 [Potamilus streckersoni]|uniref:Reverse transcriptase n=1 Tax=Potamilus streckersoni TaxID=2493646 RepID=A0AAE0VRS0_9BIVA|nr:hypothetical protein CHS0354_042734 [Potamilus streckersoni]
MAQLPTFYEGAEAIMIDILIYGRTLEEHNRRLQLVLEKLNRHGHTLNNEKYLSTIKRPIMDLLKSDTAWYWGPYQDYAFTKSGRC